MSASTQQESLTPTLSSFDDNCKRLFNRLQKYYCWRTCIAVSEMQTMRTKDLHATLVNIFKVTVMNSVVTDDAKKMRCEVPSSEDWDAVKTLLIAKWCGDAGGATVSASLRISYLNDLFSYLISSLPFLFNLFIVNT